jgi:hypothetical protein
MLSSVMFRSPRSTDPMQTGHVGEGLLGSGWDISSDISVGEKHSIAFQKGINRQTNKLDPATGCFPEIVNATGIHFIRRTVNVARFTTGLVSIWIAEGHV